MGLEEDRHSLHLFLYVLLWYLLFLSCVCLYTYASVCIYAYNMLRMPAVIARPCSSRRNEKVEEL